ncbi:MAG: M20 family metallopeptidase [Verrucomicrobiae bacterium]|nr:M20 family metallopeptidase [Verrucomicrobiae bacterium]
MSRIVELLQELVRIPSVNPQGDAGTPHTGEGEIAMFVGDFLVALGMEVEMQFVEEGRPNVIGRLRSKHSRRHLLLGPHLDTVSVTGMSIEPFSGELRDGRVWGRGACDTKGPMSAMLEALRLLVEGKRLPAETDLWFTGLMGEESGNDGIEFLMKSDFFAKRGVRPDFGIAGEPTDLRVVHRHKGAFWFRVRARGRAAHASRPDLGDNAILKMRKALDYVLGELPAPYAQLRDPTLQPSGFNVTTIRGGHKLNIIPDACEFEVDHRSLPQESHEEILARVRAALHDFEVEVISDRPGLDTPADNLWIAGLVDILGGAGKPLKERSGLLVSAPWFADCSVMAKYGVPAVAFGPGSILQAHTRDEYIEAEELERGLDVFHRWFAALP